MFTPSYGRGFETECSGGTSDAGRAENLPRGLMAQIFRDRQEAGRRLAARLTERHDLVAPVVLALPRGGLPVAREVARALHAPLDVIVVRKLGVPWQPELAMGAIASGGVRVLDSDIIRDAGVSRDDLEKVASREAREVQRREEAYRGEQGIVPLEGRTVILVDDGVATGSTAEAAVQAVRRHGADTVLLAVPVAPKESIERVGSVVDEVICLTTPTPFHAISLWYENFPQLDDTDVRPLLAPWREGWERG